MNPLPHEKIAVSSSETMAVRHAAPDTPAAPPKTPLALFREGWNCAQAAFDGQFQSLDPQNARPPVVTLSDQEADTHESTLTHDEFGHLTMQFDGVQNLQVLQTDPGTGKPVTTVVGAGSTVEAHLPLTLDAAEYDHLATLDYTRFDDTQANAVMADKNATQKLPTARQTFALEYRFVPNPLTLRVGLLATIH